MDKIKLVHLDNLSVEATCRKAPNGDLLIFCTCGDVEEPAVGNRVVCFRSTDDGDTWGKPQRLYSEERAGYQTHVSVYDDEIRVYIMLHDGHFLDSEFIVAVSRDSGYTWERESIPYFNKNDCVLIRDDIFNKDGDLLLAYQFYPYSQNINEQLKERKAFLFDGADLIPTVHTGTLIKKKGDDKFTKCSKETVLYNAESLKKWIWTEPTITMLSDGTLSMLMRYDYAGYLYRTDSFDGGKTWSDAYKTDIPNARNKVKLIKLKDGRIALLNTPNTKCAPINRNPLSLWISSDNMKTWEYKRDLVTFLGYISYPDGFASEDGKYIYFSFEFNRHDIYFMKCEI